MNDKLPTHIFMTDFNLHTYESVGSFPEVRIETTVRFPQFKQIANIDAEALKKTILDCLYYNAVKLDTPNKQRSM